MRKVTYEDERGRKYLVELDDDDSDEDAYLGIPIGPPEVVDELELPEPFATRIHNMLFDRQLWSIKELKKQPKVLYGVLQAALKIDAQTLHTAYANYSKEPE